VTAGTEPGLHIGTEGFIPPEGAGSPQADIYSLGKVLYEISTGKDRSEYPELPGNLGDSDEDRDLVRFNKIVLKACRVRPFQRFRSAEDLLTALLSFQFHASDLRRERALTRWSKAVAIIGAAIGLIGVTFGVHHLVWLLRHGH
jgi:serine/threonine protein kinase